MVVNQILNGKIIFVIVFLDLRYLQQSNFFSVMQKQETRGGVFEDVLGLEDTFSSPWPRSLKSLALASKP